MIILKKIFDTLKLPVGIILSAVLIIGFSAAISAVYSGRETAIYEVKESVSTPVSNTVTVSDILGEDSGLPDSISSLFTDSITTATCRKHTEYRIHADAFDISVRQYNYAYLTEDDPVVVPEDAIITQFNASEVFIFATSDGSQALYYKELTRYIISTDKAPTELRNLFTQQP